MQLTKLLEIIAFHDVMGDISNIHITDIVNDSRHATTGSLFICIEGNRVDGHDFARQAIENGAVCVVGNRHMDIPVPAIIVSDTKRFQAMVACHFHDYPTESFPFIGVTGTNGKTTVSYLMDEILSVEGYTTTGIIGTLQVKIADETYPTVNTTPDALEIQKIARKMRDRNVRAAVMEVSSHGLDDGRAAGCAFDVAIFTNISQDHLDYHETMENYFHAKSLLFSQLGNTYRPDKKKYAILNADDHVYEKLERSTSQHVISYGIENHADVTANDIQLTEQGLTFTLNTPVGSIAITSRMLGLFNVYNILAASAASIALNIPTTAIKQAVGSMTGVPGRMQTIRTRNRNFTTIVDYAHTPDSLENVLKAIRSFTRGNLYAIVGCGGDRDRSKRPRIAEKAVRYADVAVFTSDNPRTEEPEAIIGDMLQDLRQTNYKIIIDRKRAIYDTINEAGENDVVLIAGKGHETSQTIGHKEIHFDDRAIAEKAMLT